MNSIIFLLVLLISVSLLHLAFLTRTYVRFSIPLLLPEANNIDFPRFNPATDRLRTVISLAFFFSPLILFIAYKNLPVENITIDIITLVILFSLTCFLLYINKYKIWSKSFRTVPNKKSETDLILNSIEGTLNNHANFISLNRKKINSIDNNYTRTNREFENKISTINDEVKKNHVLLTSKTKKAEVDIEHLKNEITTIDNKHLRTKEYFKIQTTKISRTTKEIKKDIEEVKKTIINKKESVEEKESKSLESYFKSKKLFQNTETILKENNFYANKNNLTAVKLSILTYKLQKLKIININKRNKYFCKALEKQFGIKKLDPGILSNILNSFENRSAIPKHNDLLKEFVYLDKLT